jgi:hypothetical protein
MYLILILMIYFYHKYLFLHLFDTFIILYLC